jgi:hypothetical protein
MSLIDGLQALCGVRRNMAAPTRERAAALVEADGGGVDGDAQSAAVCGWFESSYELGRGLEVTEHASADAIAGSLPLADWISLHLNGWRPALACSMS